MDAVTKNMSKLINKISGAVLTAEEGCECISEFLRRVRATSANSNTFCIEFIAGASGNND